MEHPDGTVTTFAYDGLGRRVSVVDRGTASRFVWDGDELRMTFDASNALQRWESTDLNGELIAVYDATTGVSEEVLANHMGSNQDVPRDTFGNPLVVSTEFAPHALTWHTQDPTGLIFARARYLDPKTGRFLSEDPILSTNRYGYANNSPLVMWDPYGLTAAVEDSTLNKISDASKGALKEIGEEIACMLFESAAGVALVQPVGTIVSTAACAALGVRPGKGVGRGKNNLRPDPKANGPHSTFKTNPDGRITGHAEWKPNPKNPSGFDPVKRVDTQHANPHSHGGVDTPHTHLPKGQIRPSRPDELPL